jgi:hypothetical protein
MNQFVGKKPFTATALGRVLSRVKNNMLAQSVGIGIESLSRQGRSSVCVYSDPAEIMAEAGLHESTDVLIERPTR